MGGHHFVVFSFRDLEVGGLAANSWLRFQLPRWQVHVVLRFHAAPSLWLKLQFFSSSTSERARNFAGYTPRVGSWMNFFTAIFHGNSQLLTLFLNSLQKSSKYRTKNKEQPHVSTKILANSDPANSSLADDGFS